MTLLQARQKLEELANGAYCDVSVSTRGGSTDSADIPTYTVVELYIDGLGRSESQHSFQDAFDKLEVTLCQGPEEALAETETPFDNGNF